MIILPIGDLIRERAPKSPCALPDQYGSEDLLNLTAMMLGQMMSNPISELRDKIIAHLIHAEQTANEDFLDGGGRI